MGGSKAQGALTVLRFETWFNHNSQFAWAHGKTCKRRVPSPSCWIFLQSFPIALPTIGDGYLQFWENGGVRMQTCRPGTRDKNPDFRVQSDGFCGGLWGVLLLLPLLEEEQFCPQRFLPHFPGQGILCVYGSDGCAVGPRALRDNAICVSLEEGLLTQQVIFLPCFFVFSDGFGAQNACGKGIFHRCNIHQHATSLFKEGNSPGQRHMS